jgi:hypothetical protein
VPGVQGVAAQGAVHFAVDRPTPLVPGGFAERVLNATTQAGEPTAVLPALAAINAELQLTPIEVGKRTDSLPAAQPKEDGVRQEDATTEHRWLSSIAMCSLRLLLGRRRGSRGLWLGRLEKANQDDSLSTRFS